MESSDILEVRKIESTKDHIVFHFSANVTEKIVIRECLPDIKDKPSTTLSWLSSIDGEVFPVSGQNEDKAKKACQAPTGQSNLQGKTDVSSDEKLDYSEKNQIWVIKRYGQDGQDRLYSRFECWVDDNKIDGNIYVSCVHDSVWKYQYPKGKNKKGLQVRMIDDAIKIGVSHAALNINLGNVISLLPESDTFPFQCQGRTYYIRKSQIEAFDEQVKTLSDAGIVVNLILLNSRIWAGYQLDKLHQSVFMHPDYDQEGFISAFNIQTAEGLLAYLAFVEFVAGRYMREDQKYGRACGLIIGNEVNSAWVWGNAGSCSVSDYTEAYTVALRTAWLAASKYYQQARIYVSLDHLWNTSFDPSKPCQLYKGRDIIDHLVGCCEKDGDFGWNLAYHPYCENFNHPDFWNDRTATFQISTPRITFKNIEILPAFLDQDKYLYNGKIRHIIFSEQGFHSEENEESEALCAAAYCLAYDKIDRQPAIDSFILHAHIDNAKEFGLNLGIRRRDKSSGDLNLPAGPKPIYDAFKDIDTPEGDTWREKAKKIIGEKVWQNLLNVEVDLTEDKRPGDL